MISKAKHAEIAKGWSGVHYQHFPRLKKRLPFLLPLLDCLKGKDVLEFGSNAGMYGWHLAQIAKSYTGVDYQAQYHKQALHTQKFIENPNVTFLNMNVKDFVKVTKADPEKHPFNAIFMSYVLYHFSDKEVKRMKETLLPKCDIVFIQTRNAARDTGRKGRTEHNSGKFWLESKVRKWLESAGFECETHWPKGKEFHEIIGRRKQVENQG